ncbi:hypothetical protein AAH500_001761 [Salmonella enterica]|uniref:hypothetical protein n=1 Tax=Citrobacter freundii TaxID=546 RepID=UPI000EF22355|nr:hypothetical protein [Citrobacter freundii]AYL46571.1 hypothetical protein CUC46_06885 [Citrobacter freundii]EKT9311202.1 hypothetical protein [Citrobacter freundii]MEB2474748.1 hypothetical protein [Citrobacter freundii]HCL6889398.1 hypothetical protein [Citrobacter freundii]
MKRAVLALITLTSFGSMAATEISVPTDSKASYTILEKNLNGSMATITTKREGSSGVSYSKRLYDCSAWTVKYLGSGDTLERMRSSAPDKNMAPIVDNSIAYYIGQKACK